MDAVMMASGCALGVAEVLIDTNDGLSIARENAMDRYNGEQGNGKRSDRSKGKYQEQD
jgi:hypothetical protein